jgi:peroxiredoxin
MLNFFRTDCPPCVLEVPELRALQDQYGRLGLVVIGIAVYEYPEPLRAFVDMHEINYPVCYPLPMTPGAQTLWDFGVLPSASIPVTTLVDAQGKVAGHYRRYYPKEIYQEVLEPLLAPGVQLEVQRRDTSVLLSWPAEATGFVLEGTATSSLAGAAWSTITNAVTLSNGLHHVAVPVSGSARYFRLRKS